MDIYEKVQIYKSTTKYRYLIIKNTIYLQNFSESGTLTLYTKNYLNYRNFLDYEFFL